MVNLFKVKRVKDGKTWDCFASFVLSIGYKKSGNAFVRNQIERGKKVKGVLYELVSLVPRTSGGNKKKHKAIYDDADDSTYDCDAMVNPFVPDRPPDVLGGLSCVDDVPDRPATDSERRDYRESIILLLELQDQHNKSVAKLTHRQSRKPKR